MGCLKLLPPCEGMIHQILMRGCGGSTMHMLFEASSKEPLGWPDLLIWWASWVRDGIVWEVVELVSTQLFFAVVMCSRHGWHWKCPSLLFATWLLDFTAFQILNSRSFPTLLCNIQTWARESSLKQKVVAESCVIPDSIICTQFSVARISEKCMLPGQWSIVQVQRWSLSFAI